jgi:dsDNA-specific endonuclease/ATPase MutS2
MTQKTNKWKKFAAEIDHNIEKIDLHSTTNIFDALEKLEKGLYNMYIEKKEYCEVIHGIGEGKLSSAVHNALQKNPLISDYYCRGGSCLVFF